MRIWYRSKKSKIYGSSSSNLLTRESISDHKEIVNHASIAHFLGNERKSIISQSMILLDLGT